MRVECLPPELHNRPEQIPEAVQAAIQVARQHNAPIFVAYADCGTGGRLDAVLEAERVARLPGAHCYEFFAGTDAFTALTDAEPGTFYLTDFLVRHFDRLVVGGLGLDRHPELRNEYFRNYRRLIYLMQAPTDELRAAARAAARQLGLAYSEQQTGYGDLQRALGAVATVPLSAVRMRAVPQSSQEQLPWHR